MSSSMLMSAGLAAVAICAMLAANGFKGRPNTVGIDLGTTFSVVAIRTERGTDVLRDSFGRALVPSSVYFADNGDVVVGEAAKQYQNLDPKHFIYNAKRFIGRSFNDDQVSNQANLHPFHIVPNATASHSEAWFESPNGRILTPAKVIPKQSILFQIIETIYQFISKSLESKTRKYAHGGSGVGFGSSKPDQDFSQDHTSVSPESIGAHILSHLLDIAAENLGHRQITKAVMAVPAKFNGRQRRATFEAFKQAGLSVNRIIEEPTAAALAYGLDKKPNVDYILVYDIGGGTLDVSLLFVNKESVQVIATHGDDQLGGVDFDHCLAEFIKTKLASLTNDEKFLQKENIYHIELKQQETTILSLPCSESNLIVTAEKMKQQLSNSQEIELLVHSDVLQTKSSVVITRLDFENNCSDLFDRVLLPVDDLLNEALMPRSEVDEVVLVGGSSRIPRIREKLKDYFHIEHLNDEIDADLAVALGAASILD